MEPSLFAQAIFEHWSDSQRQVSPVYIENPAACVYASGNGQDYLGFFLWLLYTREERLAIGEYTKIKLALLECMKDGIWGLFNRAKGHPDQNSCENLIGIVSTSQSCADELWRYGQARVPLRGVLKDSKWAKYSDHFDALFGWIKVRFNYNNVTPGKMTKSSFMGRFPHFIAHMEYTIGRTPPLWRRLYLAYVIATSGSKEGPDQDGWRIGWTLAEQHHGRTLLLYFASLRFCARLKKRGGLRASQEGYFPANHPFMRFCE